MPYLRKITDLILGDCIRRIDTIENNVYLTFDDGPNSFCTPRVLDLLKKYNSKATFFVIGKNIHKNKTVVNRIKNEGHSIGNHSPDHSISIFFKGKRALKNWIEDGDVQILKYFGKPSIGFRPPVGIRTPELRLVMKEKKEKPLMWQHRFYDTAVGFSNKAWMRKFHKIKGGDIILLHDTHKETEQFILNLEDFIKKLIEKDFNLVALPSF